MFLRNLEGKKAIFDCLNTLWSDIYTGSYSRYIEKNFSELITQFESLVNKQLLQSTIIGLKHLAIERDPLIDQSIKLVKHYIIADKLYQQSLFGSKQPLSKIEKVSLILEIRNREGVNSFNEAIEIATKETGQFMYSSYDSFKDARRDLKDFL